MTCVEKLLIVALGVLALSFLGYIVGPAPMLSGAVSANTARYRHRRAAARSPSAAQTAQAQWDYYFQSLRS